MRPISPINTPADTCRVEGGWTATADEIITKVRVLHQDFKKLLANNS